MTKKQRALVIIDRLKKEYPAVGRTLAYNQAWKLLVSVRLAVQCTDVRVNVVVQELYAKYPTVEALAEAEVPSRGCPCAPGSGPVYSDWDSICSAGCPAGP